VVEAYRAAGIWVGPFLDSNRETIAHLSTWFTASCVLLATEVILWTLSVAG
jgi:O-phosphoseryl-tRNA(Cys) synthetase